MTIFRTAGPYQVAEVIVSWDGSERRLAHDSIKLSDGGEIIMASCHTDGTPFSIHDRNHNIFRLSKEENVIWQVVRDERGKHDMEAFYELARTSGESSYANWGFTELWLEDESGKRFRSDAWKPGLKLIALANQGLSYEVDVETGIATNITTMPHRLW